MTAQPCKHPIQPVEADEHGYPRFKANSIVRYLLDNGGIDMNDLARKGFSDQDREQFAQLIGYSLSGFSELSYVSDQTYATAHNMFYEGFDERDATIKYLEETLEKVRSGLRIIVPEVFKLHQDDLIT